MDDIIRVHMTCFLWQYTAYRCEGDGRAHSTYMYQRENSSYTYSTTMKNCTGRRLVSFLLLLLLCPLLACSFVFVPPSSSSTASPSWRRAAMQQQQQRRRRRRPPSPTRLFLFGGPADDGSPGDYVCQDCGYVFTKGPKAWAELPDSYSCPPCGAPKRRFKKVKKGSASGKVEVKKSWF